MDGICAECAEMTKCLKIHSTRLPQRWETQVEGKRRFFLKTFFRIKSIAGC